MNDANVNAMIKELSNFKGETQNFKNNTFNEDVWFGESANSAEEYLTKNVENDIDNVKIKLSNLNSAIAIAQEAEKVNKEISNIDSSISSYTSRINSCEDAKERNSLIDDKSRLYVRRGLKEIKLKSLITQIKRKCQ